MAYVTDKADELSRFMSNEKLITEAMATHALSVINEKLKPARQAALDMVNAEFDNIAKATALSLKASMDNVLKDHSSVDYGYETKIYLSINGSKHEKL